MTKVTLNPVFEQVSGALGDLVFREVNGKTILSRKAQMSNVEPTLAQTNHRERFRQAAAYGKFAIANQTTREIYDTISDQRGIPAYALTVGDFLNLPSVEQVDTTAYHGQIGDNIAIITTDDIGVVNVHVTITDDSNNSVLQSGNAVEYPVNTGHWNYGASVAVPAGTAVTVKVIATDRPGGTSISINPRTL